MAECQESARPRVSSNQSKTQQLSSLKQYHDNAFKDINHALSCDERGQRQEALRAYSQSIQNLMKGLEIQCEGSGCTGAEWDKAREMQKKMRRAAQQMKSRLEALEAEMNQSNGQSHSGGPTEDEINMQLHEEMESMEDPPSYQDSQTDAREVFTLEDGAQIFFINPQGHVSAPSSPGPLRIYKFTDETHIRESNQPPAFMQVGDWLYPLVPGESPALRSQEGAYMFPDLTGPPGSSVGLMFSPDINRNTLQGFQQTIGNFTALRQEGEAPPRYSATATPPPRPQEPPRPPQQQRKRQAEQSRNAETPEEEVESDEVKKPDQVSTKIAKGITVGAEWISWGLGKGAQATGYLIVKGKDQLKKNVKSDEKAAEIDEKYQTGVLYARKATGVAVKVSKVVVDGVCYCTKRLGEELAPVIREQGDKWLKSKDDPDGTLSKTVDGAVEVAASGLQGFGTVYLSLETAAKLLAKSLSDATVEVVQHKYGADAGRIADNSINAATNIGFTAYNINHLGAKAIAKRCAKDTGKALINDTPTSAPSSTSIPSSSQPMEQAPPH